MEEAENTFTLAETENLIVWRSSEESGFVYHVEIGPSFSLHLMPEEWEELVLLIKSASNA